jgi:hypothetical protein
LIFVVIAYKLMVAQNVGVAGYNRDSIVIAKRTQNLPDQEDIGDIFRSLFKVKVSSTADSMLEKPGKLFFSFAPAVGYTLEGGPTAVIIVNSSFYTSDPRNTNLSVFTFGGQYSLTNQLIVPVISNIWTKDNKFDWLGDWRYYQYPSKTFGLGTDNSLSNFDIVNYSYIKVYQEVLRHFSSYYYVGVGYNLDYHYDIKADNAVTDFQQYNNGSTRTTSSGPIVHFMYDNRTNSNNPKNSLYASAIFRTNSTFLGSDQNWQYLQVEIRKYVRLSSHDVLAFWSWNEFTNGKAPYFDLPSDQWDTYSNTGRGYIQGFYRGTDLVYLEAEYRFGITHNGLFGGVLFSNAGSATQWPTNKFEYVDPGEGVGLRVKFNKYSDVNLCIDYAIGLYGSRGVFFNLGEVF